MVDTSSVMTAQVLVWARKVEALRTQTTILDRLKETQGFDAIRSQNTGPKVKQEAMWLMAEMKEYVSAIL